MTTFRQIAAALGVNEGTAHRWAKRGMPMEPEAARAWRAEHAGHRVKPGAKVRAPDAAPGETGTFTHWRTRRERALALQAERAELEQRGKLFRAEAVYAAFAGRCTAAKEVLLSVASRLAPIVAAESDVHKVAELLAAEHRRALFEMAGAADELEASARDRHNPNARERTTEETP